MKLEEATHDGCAHGAPLLLDGVHLTYGWSRCPLEANSARDELLGTNSGSDCRARSVRAALLLKGAYPVAIKWESRKPRRP